MNVALGTDDFARFGAGLCDEIRHLHRAGMPLSDLANIRLGPPGIMHPQLKRPRRSRSREVHQGP